MSSLDKDRLISAVYSATLSPDDFDATLDEIDGLIFHRHAPAQSDGEVFSPDAGETLSGRLKHIIDPELITHFQRAHDIQLRFGRQKSEKSKVQLLIDAAPSPAFIFDRDENIVAMNDLAAELAQKGQPKLADCCANTDILENVRAFVANGDPQKILVEPGHVNAHRGMDTCVLVKKVGQDLDGGEPFDSDQLEKLYFFTIVNLGFDQSKTDLFRETYGLTPAEVDVAVHLASGKQLPEIADIRKATLTTVRTQVKWIKKKTNSRDVPAIVRLLCGFSAGILTSSQLPNPASSIFQDASPQKSYGQMVLRDGRRMVYLQQGNPSGTPVLMIHNMPYGVELPELAIEAADRMNLRIISPFRPGYGNSDIIKDVHGDKLLDEVAADMYELLDHLAIPAVAIVGQAIGSIYAMRFANLYPNRVSHLFAVSDTPMWQDAWAGDMPKRQRFTLSVAKHMPALLPLITHASVVMVDKGQGEKLVRSLCKDSPVDMKALQNSEIMDLMVKGCEDGLKQGAEAFRRDCFLAICDFSEEAKTLRHSFYVLHGDEDKVIDLSRAQAFAEAVPGTELEVVKGAGQLLMYSHWEHVFRAVKHKVKKS